VWDAIGSCRREGSLDQAIKDEVPNDVVGLLRQFAGIRLVLFNGRKAEQGFYRGLKELYGGDARERVPELKTLDFIRLPSSSPIPTRTHKRWQDKLAEWRIILNYLQD